MIRHSFIHLPGVGEQTERRLWDQGLYDWNGLADSVFQIFGPRKAGVIAGALEESRSAYDAGELRYFQEKLKGAHMWRLIPECIDSIAYLDIETTGLGFPPMAHSTTIAVLFKGELFIEFEPERKKLLMERIQDEARMIVTFNGLSFDLPFLRREMDLELQNPHVDLRVWLRRLGFVGGLKKIQLGLQGIPQRESMDIDGFDAVRLWRMHGRGVPNALETLMTYNAEDSIVLEPLLHLALAKECEGHSHLPLKAPPCPPSPLVPTKVDPYVYGLLRGEEEWQLPSDW